MAFKLRPGKPEDVAQIAEIFFEVFSSHVIIGRVFPVGTQPALDFWHNSLNDDFKNPANRFLVVDDVSTTPPTMAAFARWNRVEATPDGAPPAEWPSNWPPNGDPALADRFFGELGAKHTEIMGRREHWFLELIATRHAYQRKGLGAMLVQWGIDRAEEEGWQCYLDSTPDGRRLYEKLGFRTLYTTEFPEMGYTHEFMLREKSKR